MGKKNNVLDMCFNSWLDVFFILKELYISSFKWTNLPPEINSRYMERILFELDSIVFFHDSSLVDLDSNRLGFVTLHGVLQGNLDIYSEPVKMHMVAPNGYQIDRVNHKNCVIIYNTLIRVSPIARLEWYAKRIFNADKTIDVNINVQKTPYLIACNDKNVELSLLNVMNEINNFKTSIYTDKSLDVENAIKVFKLEAPFVADKIEESKRKMWNEALSFIGIDNNFSEKRERLTADEVIVSNGLANAHKYSRMLVRQQAVDEINRMFGLEIGVEFNNITMGQQDVSRGTFEGGEEVE